MRWCGGAARCGVVPSCSVECGFPTRELRTTATLAFHGDEGTQASVPAMHAHKSVRYTGQQRCVSLRNSMSQKSANSTQTKAHLHCRREGEEVQLSEDYTCVGPVEEWLMGMIDVMFATVKALIADGYATYVENPRTQWIMLYPAQVRTGAWAQQGPVEGQCRQV